MIQNGKGRESLDYGTLKEGGPSAQARPFLRLLTAGCAQIQLPAPAIRCAGHVKGGPAEGHWSVSWTHSCRILGCSSTWPWAKWCRARGLRPGPTEPRR